MPKAPFLRTPHPAPYLFKGQGGPGLGVAPGAQALPALNLLSDLEQVFVPSSGVVISASPLGGKAGQVPRMQTVCKLGCRDLAGNTVLALILIAVVIIGLEG